MDENTKRCKNCKYFIQYYIKTSISFKSTNRGHCIFTNRLKIKSATLDCCDNWTAREIDIDGNKQNVLSVLNKMHQQLDDMLLYLSYDEEN